MPYSFVPPGQGHFGGTLGGYGSLGIGQGLVNALGTGLNLAQAFRRYQNDNMLDQFRIPAQEAEANNAMLQNDFNAMQALVAKNQIQPYLATGARPGQIYDQNGNLVSQPLGSPVQQAQPAQVAAQAEQSPQETEQMVQQLGQLHQLNQLQTQLRNMSPQDMGRASVEQQINQLKQQLGQPLRPLTLQEQLQNINAAMPPGQQADTGLGQHLTNQQNPAKPFDSRYLMR